MRDRYLIGLLAAVVATAALAAPGDVTFTDPTSNTDNTLIPATGAGSLSSARLVYGSCNGTQFGTKMGEVVHPAGSPFTKAEQPVLAPGTYCAYVTRTNTYGNESAPSNVAVKVIAAPTPNAPTNFSWP